MKLYLMRVKYRSKGYHWQFVEVLVVRENKRFVETKTIFGCQFKGGVRDLKVVHPSGPLALTNLE